METESQKSLLTLKGLPARFIGASSKKVETGFKQLLKAKDAGEIRVDLALTNEYLILAPGTKDRSDLAGIGAFLGGGFFGGAAVGALSGLIELWHQRSRREQDIGDSSFANQFAIWRRSSMEVQVFEERTVWDLYGGEWQTSPRISGLCFYNGNEFETSVEIEFFGRVNNLPMRATPKDAIALMDLVGFDPKGIKRRSAWRLSD